MPFYSRPGNLAQMRRELHPFSLKTSSMAIFGRGEFAGLCGHGAAQTRERVRFWVTKVYLIPAAAMLLFFNELKLNLAQSEKDTQASF